MACVVPVERVNVQVARSDAASRGVAFVASKFSATEAARRSIAVQS